MKRHLISVLKFAVGIALLVALYYTLEDPAGLYQNVINANLWLLLLGSLTYTLAVALSGYKWGILLRAAGISISFRRLMSYQWVAEFFNNFLPAQVGGDVMRGFALASDTRRGVDAAASVLIDRFIGLSVFMLAAALASGAMLYWGRPSGVPFTPEAYQIMQLIALGSGGTVALIVFIIAALLSHRLKRIFESILAKLPLSHKTLPVWQKLAAAFHVYRDNPLAMILTALCSGLIIILTSVNIWLISQAIQPGSLYLLEALVINPILVFLLVAVPLAPGGLGIRQVSFSVLYGIIGADSDIGAAVGLIQQLLGYLVSLPGVFLWIRGRRSSSVPQTSEASIVSESHSV